MQQESGALSFRERAGYGLGDTASNFFFQTFNIFLLYYYTDVFGIPAAAVGTMFFVSKLWDALNDPLMGALSDRTQTRFGKFRPYLLWMAVPYGVMGYLMFAGPQFDDTGRLIYAWVTYTLMMMLYTAINVPYSALMGVMSPLSSERTVLSSFRFVGAFGGGLLISMLVRPMVQYFGVEDEAQGFRITMALFAVVSIALFWVTFATTRERVESTTEEHDTIRRDLKLLLRNRPWLVLCVAGVLTLSSVALKGAVTLYYFKYYVLDDGSAYFWIFDRTTFFLTMNSLALIIGVCCTKWLSDRFEKKFLMIVLSLGSAACAAGLFFVPPDQYWSMLLVSCAGAVLSGPTAPLVWAMYGDVADYGEWKFRRRTTGLIFSASMFAQKFGLTIGAGLSGWLLAAFGYVANAPQSEDSLLGIRLLFTVIPAAIALLNVLVLMFYSLSDTQVASIERELALRNSA
ncbi:MFS transporter [Halieaceae bacterium IMCC14734]|uniref:MFS transporter n=1 Tax=Candidatus Litorirhabdus singularis TaxID=2518993 RepID=A0ABT3TDY2_9GAMM|nr:MFS transporter [Candidatus Litorirhabdus singularis]MCX2980512.1 MFS transporter [Candidatus Litorirhabdus singularis]